MLNDRYHKYVYGLAIAIVLPVGFAQTATITVGLGESIQEAIDAAEPGDTIKVQSGIYLENVNVTKQLTLVGLDTGSGMPIVAAGGNGNAITLSVDGIFLEGFEATNASAGLAGTGKYVFLELPVDEERNVGSKDVPPSGEEGSSHEVIPRPLATLPPLDGEFVPSKPPKTQIHGKAGIMIGSNGNMVVGNSVRENDYGILLISSSNNTIRGNKVTNSQNGGIDLKSSSYNFIEDNNVAHNLRGIGLQNSDHNTLTDNNASNSITMMGSGIELSQSQNNILRNNSMVGSAINFICSGADLYYNDVDVSNLVDGRLIYVLRNVSGAIIDSSSNAGTVCCFDCENVTIKDSLLDNNFCGIFLYNTNGSTVENNSASENEEGISIIGGCDNLIESNYVNNNLFDGIKLESSDDNAIIGNEIVNNGLDGIILSDSDNNTVTRNNASNNENGISLVGSNENEIYLNDFRNNIKNNAISATSLSDPDNKNLTNFWNSTEPITYRYNGSGFVGYMGNYWSGHEGVDASGDGLGDEPYVMDGIMDNLYCITDGGAVVDLSEAFAAVPSEDEQPLMEPLERYTITEAAENLP